MDKMIKVFDSEIRAIDEKETTLTAFISTNARDRMDEVLDPLGVDLKNFNKNPVVLWAHQYDQPPIGKALWTKREGDTGILSKVKFAPTPFAQEIFQLYKGGFLKAFSVGFIPKEHEDGDGEKTPRRIYKKWEMLEYSAVPVPANPEALALAMQNGILTNELIIKAMECPEGICKTTITKPEETDDYIRIPIRDCEITATITISDKEGIKALYCGKVKKIATYLFEKAKGWTMEKAKEWVKDHKEGNEEGLDELLAENKLIKEQLSAKEKGISDLRYEIYKSYANRHKDLPEITGDDFLKRFEEIFAGVIRKAQGKVS